MVSMPFAMSIAVAIISPVVGEYILFRLRVNQAEEKNIFNVPARHSKSAESNFFVSKKYDFWK